MNIIIALWIGVAGSYLWMAADGNPSITEYLGRVGSMVLLGSIGYVAVGVIMLCLGGAL